MYKDYKCECGNIIEFRKEYGKDFPETIKCDVCGKDMKKVISGNIIIPEHMKSALGFQY